LSAHRLGRGGVRRLGQGDWVRATGSGRLGQGDWVRATGSGRLGQGDWVRAAASASGVAAVPHGPAWRVPMPTEVGFALWHYDQVGGARCDPLLAPGAHVVLARL